MIYAKCKAKSFKLIKFSLLYLEIFRICWVHTAVPYIINYSSNMASHHWVYDLSDSSQVGQHLKTQESMLGNTLTLFSQLLFLWSYMYSSCSEFNWGRSWQFILGLTYFPIVYLSVSSCTFCLSLFLALSI